VISLSARSASGLALTAILLGVVLTTTLLATRSSHDAPSLASVSHADSAAQTGFASAHPSECSTGDDLRQLVVNVFDPDGRAFLKPWSLALRSAQHAPRDLTFAAGSEDIRIEVGPGRWTLVPTADELVSRTVVVDVDAAQVEANLRFLPAAQIFGTILDDRGVPVIGLPLGLRSFDGELAAWATSDEEGTFHFASIPEGGYELLAGRSESPLRPTRVVHARAGRQVIEPMRIPALSESTLRVVGEDGSPVPGATVEGTGQRGGGFAGSTGADGVYLARFLPPGRYRVTASRDDLGSGEGWFEMGSDGAPSAAIMLRR
jgi:hypothetical protein